MKKRKLLVTGGLAASLILSNISPAYAQNKINGTTSQPTSKTSSKTDFSYEPGSGLTLDEVAVDLGIDADEFREELRRGKTPKQVLLNQGFNPSQIQKIFRYAATHESKIKKHTNDEDEDEDKDENTL